MLTIKTIVKPSTIHGLGLFTLQPVKRGDVVWRRHVLDMPVLQEQIDHAPPLLRAFLSTYVFKCKGQFILCFDGARYMNHLPNPSVDVGRSSDEFFALRDLEPGDEMTCRYDDFDRAFREKTK